MNFDYSDDQQAIKSTARDFLASRFKLEKVRELAEKGEYDDGLWGQIAELGWPGIFIEESNGGQDLGVLELSIIQEELGYACAPTPFFSNAAAGLLVKHAGSSEQQERLLPGVASGEARGTVGIVVDGAAPLVPDADAARLVLSGDPDGVAGQIDALGDGGIDTIGIIGFGNTDVVQDTLRRFALDVMARSTR